MSLKCQLRLRIRRSGFALVSKKSAGQTQRKRISVSDGERRKLLRPQRLAIVLLSAVLSSGFVLTVLGQSQAADKEEIQPVIRRFFALYEAKDLRQLMEMWTGELSDLEYARRRLWQTFDENDEITVRNLSFADVSVQGDKATARVSLEITFTNAKPDTSAQPTAPYIRIFQLARSGDDWRIVSFRSPEEQLAVAIESAATQEERESLLRSNKELANSDLAIALGRLADRLIDRGEHARAEAIDKLAMRVAESTNDKRALWLVSLSFGNLYLSLNRVKAALEFYERSKHFAEERADKREIAISMANIGLAYRSFTDYPNALRSLETAYRLATEADDERQGGYSALNIGLVKQALGDYMDALQHYDVSSKLLERIEDKRGLVRLLNNIANVHYLMGDHDTALRHYAKSLSIAKELGHKPNIGFALSNIGLIDYDRGNYLAALQHSQEALEIFQDIGDEVSAAEALNQTGLVHLAQRDYTQAMEDFKHCREVSQRRGNWPGLISALHSIGLVNAFQGDYAKALSHFSEGLRLAQQTQERGWSVRITQNIAGVYSSQGKYDQALENLTESLKQAEQLRVPSSIAQIMTSMATIYWLKKDNSRGLDLTQQAATTFKAIGEYENYWYASSLSGRCLQALGRGAEARVAFEDAIDAIETLRTEVVGGALNQEQTFARQVDPYYAIIGLLVNQQNPREALSYAERSKSRALFDLLRSGKISVTKAMTTEEKEHERSLNNRMVSLNRQFELEKARSQADSNRLTDLEKRIEEARSEYRSYQADLYARHPELQMQRGKVMPISASHLEELTAKTGSMIIEFVVTNDKTYAFVISAPRPRRPISPKRPQGRPGSNLSRELSLEVYTVGVGRQQLADRVSLLRNRLASIDIGFESLAMELYELLFGPVRQRLRNATSLVVVPDGPLWELPFQALMPEAERFLIEDLAISYAPSLAVLHYLTTVSAPAKKRSPSLLAFGNPAVTKDTASKLQALMGEKLEPLLDAERLVTLLRRLYDPAKTKVYVGPGAREDVFKTAAGKYNVIQIASHGIFDNKSPMYSHLVLSQSEVGVSEDGLLEAWEIMNLDLKADLFVLSACETARGRISNGEGIIGLSWATFVAGARATVVSQWGVDAGSTTDLMVEFHRVFRSGKSKAEALRQASLKLLRTRRYRHPFYWAPFVVLGDSR